MTYIAKLKLDKYSNMVFPNSDFNDVSELETYIVMGSCPMRYFDSASAFQPNSDGSCKVEKYSESRQLSHCMSCWNRNIVLMGTASVDEYALYLELKAKYET